MTDGHKLKRPQKRGIGHEKLEPLKDSFGRDVKVEVADDGDFSTFGAEDLPIFGVEGFA